MLQMAYILQCRPSQYLVLKTSSFILAVTQRMKRTRAFLYTHLVHMCWLIQFITGETQTFTVSELDTMNGLEFAFLCVLSLCCGQCSLSLIIPSREQCLTLAMYLPSTTMPGTARATSEKRHQQCRGLAGFYRHVVEMGTREGGVCWCLQ